MLFFPISLQTKVRIRCAIFVCIQYLHSDFTLGNVTHYVYEYIQVGNIHQWSSHVHDLFMITDSQVTRSQHKQSNISVTKVGRGGVHGPQPWFLLKTSKLNVSTCFSVIVVMYGGEMFENVPLK